MLGAEITRRLEMVVAAKKRRASKLHFRVETSFKCRNSAFLEKLLDEAYFSAKLSEAHDEVKRQQHLYRCAVQLALALDQG